jgi:competence protein ComEC
VFQTGGIKINPISHQEIVVVNQVTRITKVKLVPGLTYWWWVRQIGEWRKTIDNIYRIYLSEPYAGLLSGIVLGTNNQMNNELYTALVRTGTMHVVAASGFNITLVAGAGMSILLIIFRRRIAAVLSILLIMGYVIMAGGGASVMRAGMMGGLAALAQVTGKTYAVGWMLGVAILVMLIAWPWLLISVSFQLLVAATVGLVWGQKRMAKLIGKSVDQFISEHSIIKN